MNEFRVERAQSVADESAPGTNNLSFVKGALDGWGDVSFLSLDEGD